MAPPFLGGAKAAPATKTAQPPVTVESPKVEKKGKESNKSETKSKDAQNVSNDKAAKGITPSNTKKSDTKAKTDDNNNNDNNDEYDADEDEDDDDDIDTDNFTVDGEVMPKIPAKPTITGKPGATVASSSTKTNPAESTTEKNGRESVRAAYKQAIEVSRRAPLRKAVVLRSKAAAGASANEQQNGAPRLAKKRPQKVPTEEEDWHLLSACSAVRRNDARNAERVRRETNAVVVLTRRNRELIEECRRLRDMSHAHQVIAATEAQNSERIAHELEAFRMRHTRERARLDEANAVLTRTNTTLQSKILELEHRYNRLQRLGTHLRSQNSSLRAKLDSLRVDYTDIITPTPTTATSPGGFRSQNASVDDIGQSPSTRQPRPVRKQSRLRVVIPQNTTTASTTSSSKKTLAARSGKNNPRASLSDKGLEKRKNDDTQESLLETPLPSSIETGSAVNDKQKPDGHSHTEVHEKANDKALKSPVNKSNEEEASRNLKTPDTKEAPTSKKDDLKDKKLNKNEKEKDAAKIDHKKGEENKIKDKIKKNVNKDDDDDNDDDDVFEDFDDLDDLDDSKKGDTSKKADSKKQKSGWFSNGAEKVAAPKKK